MVVVEDLISTGGSSLKAVEALRQYGVEVIGMVASFTYGFPVAEEAFREAGVKLITLSNYEAVVEEAAKTGYIKEEDKAVLAEWRKSPSTWKQSQSKNCKSVNRNKSKVGLFDNTTKFESSVKQIPYSQEAVYRNISDLRNLEKVRDRVPEDKVNDFAFDQDTVSLNVPPVGELKLRIIERDEPKCVKFETAQSPVPFNVWIQVLPVDEQTEQDEGDGEGRAEPLHQGHGQRPAAGRRGEDCRRAGTRVQ